MSNEKRRSFLNDVIDAAKDPEIEKQSNAAPVSGGGLEDRMASVSRAGEQQRERITRLRVPPERCCIWHGNGRNYAQLNEQNCADLIQGFEELGGQKTPAVVRPSKTPGFDFEVIVGTRRHWTAVFRKELFLIEVDESLANDEHAFRVADVENRSRQDLSDYERAIDYKKALASFYGGHQGRMAAVLQQTDSWLSRFLDLAEMPKQIVEAYPTLQEIKTGHMKLLKPFLADSKSRNRILDAARDAKGRVKDGTELIKLLTNKAKARKNTKEKPFVVLTGTNQGLIEARRNRNKLSIVVNLGTEASESEIVKGVKQALGWAKE